MPLEMKLVLLRALSLFARIIEILVLARVLMSWFPVSFSRETQWYHRLRELVWRLTEPFLDPIRRLLPFGNFGIDFSPLVLLLVLNFLLRLLSGLLLRL